MRRLQGVSRRDRAAAAVARLLLRLYPAELRDDSGAELIEAHRLRSAERAAEGPVRWILWLARAALALVASAPGAWREVRQTRPRRGDPMLGHLSLDLRFALRTLLRSPGFALVAVASLAVGIGANTALFTVIDAALLQPLPVQGPEQLVRVVTDRGESVNYNHSYPRFADLDRDADAFTGVAAHRSTTVTLTTGAGAEPSHGAMVSGDFFEVVGVPQGTGRTFGAEDDATAASVAVLAHPLAERLFGGAGEALGETLRLNDEPFTVVGVTPAGFQGIERGRPVAWYVPIRSGMRMTGREADEGDRGSSWLDVVGRLRAGSAGDDPATLAALARVDRAHARAGLLPDGQSTVLIPAGRGFTGAVESMSGALWLLFGAVGIVLLIACANVAGLLLVRGAARTRELGVRVAIGASRRRIVRQLLTESLLLGGVAGGAGVLLSVWLTRLLTAYRPPTPGGAVELDVSLDGRVLLFALGLSLLTAVLFGTLPALRLARQAPAAELRAGGRGDTSDGGSRLRGALVAGQVALSLVLIMGATVLVRSFANLRAVDIGYGEREALLAELDVEARGWDEERGRIFFDELGARVAALPGVEAVTWASVIHPNPGGSSWGGIPIEPASGSVPDSATFDFVRVGTGFFEAMGLPVARGRGFTPADARDAPRVAVINEAMAEQYWSGVDALGKQIHLPIAETSTVVVGVVPDGKYRGLREGARATVYVPFTQVYLPSRTLVVHTPGDAASLTRPLRETVASLDAGIPLGNVRTLEDHIATASSQERLAANMSAVLGGVALLLAAIGLYGVLAYTVARRKRELGVRLALGAGPDDLLRMVLRGALLLLAGGLAVGVPAALAAGRVLRGIAYGTSPTDPRSLALAVAVLAVVTCAAAIVPAWRATRVDPLEALRQE